MPPRSTHVQPGDVSHALIQKGERERLGKTPSSSSTTAWWWWRSVAILQGFAKHRGRGGGREVGLRHGEVKTHVLAAPKSSSIYRGEGGGAPPLGFPPQGVRQPQSHLRVAAKGGEGGNLPPKLGGSTPSPNPRRLGPLWGGAPAHLGLVPSHTWPMHPSGAGGPTWWTPGTLPVVPVRYR